MRVHTCHAAALSIVVARARLFRQSPPVRPPSGVRDSVRGAVATAARITEPSVIEGTLDEQVWRQDFNLE